MVRVGGTRPVAPEFGPQPSFPLSVKSRGPSDRPWRGKPGAALGLFARSFASGGHSSGGAAVRPPDQAGAMMDGGDGGKEFAGL